MTTALYLEQYLDSLEALPADLQRNFNLMRDLDQRTQDILQKIEVMRDNYLSRARSMSSTERTGQLKEIDGLFGRTKVFGDDKVNLANQTYEMVDKHIRRLDSDLARFEAELKEKAQAANSSEQDTKNNNKSEKKKKRKSEAPAEAPSDDEVPNKKGRKKGQPLQEVAVPTVNGILPLASLGAPSDVLDMPVDPNEPTYCLCGQVSYGEMIGCDNPDCPIEWFHFPCVQLTAKPKGKWFCPRCIDEKKKGR